MKKVILSGSLVCLLLVAVVATAQTLFLTVTAPPYSEAGGSATVDGPTHIYLTISPSAELHKPKSIVNVYENGSLLGSYQAIAVSEKLIATYTADARRTYTLEVQEMDGTTLTAQLFYD